MTSGSSLYFYAVDPVYWTNVSAFVAALQQGTADAIDVMNHSYALTGLAPELSWCCGDCDYSSGQTSYNAALRNTTNAGTLHVFAAGNTFMDDSTCTVEHPALRRDGLAIGALGTTNSATAYDSVGMWWDSPGFNGSAVGGMNITVDGWPRQATLVDLVAPGCYDKVYAADYDGTYVDGDCGTSLSAPSVAGSIALLKHALYSVGWIGMTPRLHQAYALMMGSGWSYTTGTVQYRRLDKRSGAGRYRNYWPSSANLTPPWGMGCHEATLSPGQTRAYSVGDSSPESSLVQTWKAALTWQEDSFTNAADLDLQVWNVCPKGGGNPILVKVDGGYDLRERLRLTSSDIGGKCLEFRVVAWTIPAGQTRTFQVCDYFQSGSASNH